MRAVRQQQRVAEGIVVFILTGKSRMPTNWDAVRDEDGQYSIGIEWDAPRDVCEVNIEFRPVKMVIIQ